MRRLANMLAAVGCHVLRFDYFGTGDSMGTAHEVTRRGWEQDIETAIEELQDTWVLHKSRSWGCAWVQHSPRRSRCERRS